MAKLAQSATTAPETKLTLASSHFNGFRGHRAKAFSERDSLERVGTRLMTLQKMPRDVGGRTISCAVLSITIFSRFRGKSRHRPITPRKAVDHVQQIADGLSAAH